MQPILVFRHGANIPAGYLGDVLADAGVPVATVPLYAGAQVPADLDWSAVVSLGGEMGAYEKAKYPYLAAEKAFLRRAVDAGLPVLGVCLGCQLLADALGGRAYKADALELGHLPVELTETGAADPVVSRFDAPTLIWHHDTWDVPPGGELLARTEAYPQAFRLGSALGMQPHPEVSPEIAKGWVEVEGAADFAEAGIDPQEFLAGLEASREEGERLARAVFGAWLDGVVS